MQPGAGLVVTRGLDVLRELTGAAVLAPPGTERAHSSPSNAGQAEDDAPYAAFVQRLIQRPYGFYVAVGEPGRGKTTLALRLARRLYDEHGYTVRLVGGAHPDDRAKHRTAEWTRTESPEAFVAAMKGIADTMLEDSSDQYPAEIQRQVVLVDDASLIANVGEVRFNRALAGLWNVCRHMSWIGIVTMRAFKSVTTVAEGADARFLFRPDYESLGAIERGEALLWWKRADAAFAERFGPRATSAERGWVYVDAGASLGYQGLVPFSPPIHAGGQT